MPRPDSRLDAANLRKARALLAEREPTENITSVVAAAAFFAVSALALAVMVIAMPLQWR